MGPIVLRVEKATDYQLYLHKKLKDKASTPARPVAWTASSRAFLWSPRITHGLGNLLIGVNGLIEGI